MKLQYALKEFDRKTIKTTSIQPIAAKTFAPLKKIIRLPSRVALSAFVSLSFPVKATDVSLVEKTLATKLNVKKRFYVIEVHRA